MNHSYADQNRRRPKTVVAIPARDEADRIVGCLSALDRQEQRPDAVVLLLNNCIDATEAVVRRLRSSLRFDLHIVCRTLPAKFASAGHARRIAMAFAARRAAPGGILLTTDADALVPPDWIQRNLLGLSQGADLVCGRVVLDPCESRLIPAHLHADDERECTLLGLLDEMAWIIDPDPADPPPRHVETSGASLAVSVAAFRRVGGVPPVSSGEDRALFEALRRVDARIRHDPEIMVAVSGRIAGRAEGGMADTIRRRMVRQDEFTDDQVEPANHALQRLTLRRRARSAWLKGVADLALSSDLRLDPGFLNRTLASPFFGSAWAKIEANSPRLRRVRVRFDDLAAEIAAARRILARFAAETEAAD